MRIFIGLVADKGRLFVSAGETPDAAAEKMMLNVATGGLVEDFDLTVVSTELETDASIASKRAQAGLPVASGNSISVWRGNGRQA